jgi:N-acetylglutamate synthase-like GNAT family acetyltransferase
MIRPLRADETETLLEIINAGAQAYRGVIPVDCWHEPYMSSRELEHELQDGVRFWGWEKEGRLVGVMGRQDLGEVILIRHAYVHPAYQQQGIGARLLDHLLAGVNRPVLVGTWAAAHWAVTFYEKKGFALVSPQEKERLLRTYWTISDRQIETSVVLQKRA